MNSAMNVNPSDLYSVVGTTNGMLWARWASLETAMVIAREEAIHDVTVVGPEGPVARCRVIGDVYVEEEL